MSNKKPIRMYADTKFKKTKYCMKLEREISEFSLIDDDIVQKSLNTSLKLLSNLNPTESLVEVETIVSNIQTTINNNGSIKEVKSYVSLLNSKLDNLIKPKNDIVIKSINNDKKVDILRLKTIMFEHRFSTQKIFCKLFYFFSLLSYSKDKNVIFRLNNLSDKSLIDYLKKNYKFLSFDKMNLHTLYSYGGGKKKFYEPLNTLIENMVKTKSIKKFIDPFMGGIGSYYSSFNVIKKKNINVILNDLNPSIYNLNKHIQSKRDSKKILQNISLLIQKMFIETDMFEPNITQYREFHQRLLKVLNYREKKEGENRSVFSSSILLFLLNNNFGGNYTTTKNGSYCSIPTDMSKVDRFFNFVGKVELYNYLYTSVRVKFENKDYLDVLKKHSRKEDTYTTFDPPYLNQSNLTIREFETKLGELESKIKNATNKKEVKKYSILMNKLLEGSSYNYGFFGDNFNHEQLLKDLSMVKGEISYFNYGHPIIGKYRKKYGLDIEMLGRKTNNGQNKKGSTIKTKYEVFMTGRIQS